MALIDISLPDSIDVTDSIEVELITFEPQLSDSIDVTDAIETESVYHVELSDSIGVTDEIEVERSQVPGEIHVELSDSIDVTDALEALLIDGNIHTVVSVTPQRGRTGQTITIVGTGFSAANNSVRLDNVLCSILSQGVTEIVVTQPATVNVVDGFAVLRVSNFDNNRTTDVPYWIKDTVANLETKRLPDQEPGPEEFAGSVVGGAGSSVDGETMPDPTRAEARMWERMATMIDFLLRDTLVANGDLFTHDGVGLTLLDGDVAGEEDGQRLVADSTAAEGIRWGHVVDIDPPYGIRIPAGTTTGVLARANGENTASATGDGDEWVAPRVGEVDAVYAYQQSTAPNTDRLDRVRVLVNGSPQHDSGTGLGVAHRGRYFAGSLGIAVVAGDRVQLEVTKTGATETMDVLGAVRIQSS